MLATLLGSRVLDFVADDGSKIKGTQLFVSFTEDGVTGQAADKFFVKDGMEIPAKLAPGLKVEIDFNRKGKVEGVYTPQ